MPELMSTSRQADAHFWQLEQLIAGRKDHKHKIRPDRGYDTALGDVSTLFSSAQSPPKKTRAKESSKHFGVRFRPDLQKWVAEIRVAEWKSVDKKVWLGTFDSEEGAARAVDAARKLLKCTKKRPPNFPCESLQAYSEKIPANLNLTNLRDESMFKEVTAFVKRKAQEYAATFCPNKAASSPCLSEQLPLVAHPYQVGDGNGCFHFISDVEPRRLFTLLEDDTSPSGYSPSSSESYGMLFPSCEGVTSHPWNSPTSVTCSGPPSCSSAGTSPEDESWIVVQPNMWSQEQLAHIGDDVWMNLQDPLPGSWEEQMPMEMDDPYLYQEYGLFNMEDYQDQCHVGDMNMLRDEAQVMSMECQNNDSWMLQSSFNINTYNSLSNSDYREVC